MSCTDRENVSYKTDTILDDVITVKYLNEEGPLNTK